MTEVDVEQTLTDEQRAVVIAQLAGVPGLLQELEVTLTRQHQFLQRGSGGRSSEGAEFMLPFNIAAGQAIDGIVTVLRRYGAAVAELLAVPAPAEPARRARWLALELLWVPADSPALADMASALSDAVAAGWQVIDRPDELMYVGVCEKCRMPLYAEPDAKTGECSRCRAVFFPEQLRDTLIARARYQYGSAAELARLLPWFDDRPVTESAIRKAGDRGKLTRYQIGGRIVYQIGEVIDWHNRGRS